MNRFEVRDVLEVGESQLVKPRFMSTTTSILVGRMNEISSVKGTQDCHVACATLCTLLMVLD